jgi:anthranilate synthase/aminodeoxychorismate synthase-like glutamine amidotransferase
MILIIDNQDSYTRNIAIAIDKMNLEFEIISNKKHLNEISHINKVKKLIISPGPGTPAQSRLSLQAFNFFEKQIPILGICLGHQLIAEFYQGQLVKSKDIIHGKAVILESIANPLFKDIPNRIKVIRYNSLTIENLKAPLIATGFDHENGELLSFMHMNLPIFGVQFHPDSYKTEYGNQIINNFLQI